MNQLISKEKASGILARYHRMLETTGYAKRDYVVRILMYLFLIDLVEYTHLYITEKDYKLLELGFTKLFTNGGCLLPYPTSFCNDKSICGESNNVLVDYAGSIRINEQASAARITNDDIVRIPA